MPSGSKLPLKLQLKCLLHFVFLPHFFCAFKCAHDLRQLQVFARFVELKILEPCLTECLSTNHCLETTNCNQHTCAYYGKKFLKCSHLMRLIIHSDLNFKISSENYRVNLKPRPFHIIPAFRCTPS